MHTIEKDLCTIHDKLAQAIEYIQFGVTGKRYDPSWMRPMCLLIEERKQDYITGIRALSEVLQWCADNMEPDREERARILKNYEIAKKITTCSG